ncbi:hypothetical protein B0H63DRAFT_463997 [Podospora didyma]|uniref:Rhodopsin domain-containing protein n=1 Tax=Podospora didyma TaxID=330526 RepID=A0AAE0U3U5_9PEZI|nr:hypothetical protein B0H63DRAFT_463997 [Podospora didyma]
MAPAALVETWALYSVGSLVILARIICRWRLVGVYNFKPDDYLIFLAWATYTAMTVEAHVVGGLGDLHALTIEQREALTPEAAAPLVEGTKWFCAGVATYITFIWILKINMLFLYQRVVNGLWVAKFIVPTMIMVGVTWAATMMILFLPCRPYNRMWIVFPDQGEYCKPQSFLNMVPPLIMNLVTDLCIMAIPAPVIIPVRTTIWRKMGLVILFFAGFFIMTAAILRVVMVLVLGNGPTAAIWSCREDIIAIIVGQAILIRPMFTRKFWSRDYASGTYSSKSHSSSKRSSKKPKVGSGNVSGSFEMGGAGNSAKRAGFGKIKDPFSVTAALATVQGDDENDNGSTEKIVSPSSSSSTYDTMGTPTTGDEEKRETAHPDHGNDLERGVVDISTGERGPYHDSRVDGIVQPGRIIINVSRQVEVENMESGRTNFSRPIGGHGDYLNATNDANCWR